jgi:MinD-like ATPase involved in chromosome partitioning or flagellar assembly
MSKIVSVHSFRGGTGKSNTTANLATILAADGLRVGVVDTDIQSPGIHVLFGMDENDMGLSLNDYLYGKADIKQTAHDVSDKLDPNLKGKLYLIPSSIKTGDIGRVIREGFDVDLLYDGFHNLVDVLKLDVLMIDTHPGLNEETMLSIALSDALAIIMRPDSQDYQGTGVTVEVARKLGVARLVIIVNKTPQTFDTAQVRDRVEKAYGAEVAGVLPHSEEMMTLASSGIFALKYPDHPMTELYRKIAHRLIE